MWLLYQLGSMLAQLGLKLASYWLKLASVRQLGAYTTQDDQTDTHFVEFCSQHWSTFDVFRAPEKQKYITIVAPNGFSRFSTRDLKNLDFFLILKPSRDIFEASWRARKAILDVLRPTWANIEPSWAILEPTWRHLEPTWSQHDPPWPNLSQHGANLNAT